MPPSQHLSQIKNLQVLGVKGTQMRGSGPWETHRKEKGTRLSRSGSCRKLGKKYTEKFNLALQLMKSGSSFSGDFYMKPNITLSYLQVLFACSKFLFFEVKQKLYWIYGKESLSKKVHPNTFYNWKFKVSHEQILYSCFIKVENREQKNKRYFKIFLKSKSDKTEELRQLSKNCKSPLKLICPVEGLTLYLACKDPPESSNSAPDFLT